MLELVGKEQGWGGIAGRQNWQLIAASLANGNLRIHHTREDYREDNFYTRKDHQGYWVRELQWENTWKPWVRPNPNGVITMGHEDAAGNTAQHYHLLGASLFDIADGSQWLGILDERQYCMIQLPKHCETVDDALDSLKPPIVRTSSNVERQGDWFFIPVPVDLVVQKFADLWPRRSLNAAQRALRYQALPDPRPAEQQRNQHSCRFFTALDGTVFATGFVKHFRGRSSALSGEHHTLPLGSNWYHAIRNLEVRSLTVGGRGVARFD